MSSELTLVRKRIFRGLQSKGFAQIVTIFLQLVSVPIFLFYWGADTYGIWLILTAIPAYLSLSDLGFANVSANHMTMAVARGDKKEALKAFQSVWLLVSCLSIGIFIFIYILTEFFDVYTMLNFEVSSNENISNTLLLIISYVLVSLQGNIINAGYRCDGNFAKGIFIDSFIRLIENVFVFIIVAYGFGILEAALTLVSVRSILLFASSFYLFNLSKWLSYGYKNSDIGYLKKLMKPSFSFMLIPLTNAIILQGFTILVGQLMTPVAVVTLTTVRTLTRLGIQIVGMVNQVLMPELSILLSKQKMQEARTLVFKGLRFNILISVIFYLGVFVFGKYILELWTSGKITPEQPFILCMAGAVIIHAIANSFSTLLISVNKHSNFAVLGLFSASSAFILSYYLINFFGLLSIGIGTLTYNFLLLIIVIPQAFKYLNISYRNAFKLLISKQTVL